MVASSRILADRTAIFGIAAGLLTVAATYRIAADWFGRLAAT